MKTKSERPLILVSSNYGELKNKTHSISVNEDYLSALERSGANAVVASTHIDASFAELFDGLLLSGGVDVLPSHYGESEGENCSFCPERDEAELALFKAFFNAGKPIFGICRGVQLLNVALGGSLYQDIPDHTARIEASRLYHRAKKEFSLGAFAKSKEILRINSYHHQSIKRLGEGLVCTYRADDGTIEAVAHEKLDIFGVQWHPERTLEGKLDSSVCDDGKWLFDHYVSLCRNKRDMR